MNDFHDYFICDDCGNMHFKPVFNFSIRFYGVNFSDDLVYDKLKEESYRCTQCGKMYTPIQIEERLAEFKKARKKQQG